jgi:hypothetical protein
VRRALLAAAAIGLAACAAGPPPLPSNAVCAALFDRLDVIEFTPQTGFGFDFRQAQLARIREGRCLTFTREISGLETFEARPAPAPTGLGLRPTVAVQAGVVTNMDDDARALAFFQRFGYRARSVGSAGLGRRIYVEATTQGAVLDIVALAGAAGFVGAYPSRFVAF